MRRTATIVISSLLGVAMLVPVAFAGGQSSVKEARQATSSFHDVGKAEAAGYESTLEVLGCFDNSQRGGMGLHYLKGSLVDDEVKAGEPEALVYEMRANGDLKLVGLEYLVPEEFVNPLDPPELFGQQFHEHPVLPFWILHAYIWKPNPSGMFEDFNPSVRMCPEGVPVFGS